jgi:hypothetical protein
MKQGDALTKSGQMKNTYICHKDRKNNETNAYVTEGEGLFKQTLRCHLIMVLPVIPGGTP